MVDAWGSTPETPTGPGNCLWTYFQGIFKLFINSLKSLINQAKFNTEYSSVSIIRHWYWTAKYKTVCLIIETEE